MTEKGVDRDLYNVLVNAARNAARLEDQVADTISDGIRAAVQVKDLDTFDRTYRAFEEGMRKSGIEVPLAIESMHVVVHEAAAKGIPLTDELGVPRHFAELRRATSKKRRKRRKKTQH